MICPGFSADCLETLEEVAMENREVFLEAGGEEYAYIPCLNAEAAHVDMLAGLVLKHTREWMATESPEATQAALAERRKRAEAIGAKT